MGLPFQFSMTRLMIAVTLAAFTLASGRLLGGSRFAVVSAVLTPILLMMTVCTFIKGKDGAFLVLCAAAIVLACGASISLLVYMTEGP